MYTSAVSFDTHKYVKEFIKAGMPEPQAEAVVSLINESKDYDISKLATREQIVLFKQETKNDIERLDQKIESSVEMLDQKIESSVERLDQKIESSFEKLDQKIDSLEEIMNTKLLAVEHMIESSRKSTIIWVASIMGAGMTSVVFILFKYMPTIAKIVEAASNS